ncbi:Uncharacterized protein PECH_008887 [Penicillium ucsense]|uniref:Calcofluor white hypersensitive protein n=1 Tax=Penicillium ucsense TaxID=2839758 RepID=A0A8J8W7U3_9EURO|nr:Uncharacterized protein PECM_004481 [Penicillium ucsense]KAF7733815.1 Uncharacterized protein PECH_008887 [Penicillium ucsense]
MSKPRTGLYLGLAAAGAGGYYLYRAGGDPQIAKNEMKIDANKAREKLPTTDHTAEKTAKNAGADVGEAIDNARLKANLTLDNSKQHLEEGKKQLENYGKEARDQFNSTVDKVDRTVEQKAAEAKGTVSGWFSGKS